MRLLHRFARDDRGTMALETALIAPLLASMALGAFDVSMMISREQHLQSAANEASEIILAASGGSGISSANLDTILESSLNLPGKITISQEFRCATNAKVKTVPTCPSGQQLYRYILLSVTDSYVPLWTKFGVGQTINYNIERTVQIG